MLSFDTGGGGLSSSTDMGDDTFQSHYGDFNVNTSGNTLTIVVVVALAAVAAFALKGN